MVTGPQIAEVVQTILDEVLSKGVAPEKAPEAAADIDTILRRELLGDAVFGDIVFKDGRYYTTNNPSYNKKADTAEGLILRYLLDHEGQALSKKEIYKNIQREPSTCDSVLPRWVFDFVNRESEVYEAFKEGRAPTKYGIRKIQEAPQDT